MITIFLAYTCKGFRRGTHCRYMNTIISKKEALLFLCILCKSSLALEMENFQNLMGFDGVHVSMMNALSKSPSCLFCVNERV